MNEESSDPIAYIERDTFSHHPSNPFEPPADDASSDPILLTPSKRKSKREKPRVQAIKEEGYVRKIEEQPSPELDATVVLQKAPPRDEQEENAEIDETQDAEQAMEGGCVEDETMEDYEEPVGDHELSEGDFRERTSDELLTLDLKSPREQAEIEEEMEDLAQKVPQLADDYELLDRLGTGTFSAVYKAIDLHYHEQWDNALWHGKHPPHTSAWYQSRPRQPGMSSFVAIKRILVTSAPRRVMNEIVIMETCRGCRHVAQLITAFGHEDQVLAVMPYQKSEEFKEYYKTLPIEGVRQYFRCMFRALRDIHARGIIHRDLKPANFLFNPTTWEGTMVDFGLAETFEYDDARETACQHTAPTEDYPHGQLKEGQRRLKLAMRAHKVSRDKSVSEAHYVGWPTDDTRPPAKANRAGTRGFRAPEVLFKCTTQTPAVDIWSVGTVMLFFLSGRFPIFNANSDMEALMEQAAILGRDVMEDTAALHNRTFSTNITTFEKRTPWYKFVQTLNPDLFNAEATTPKNSASTRGGALLKHAADLLDKCLDPDNVTRITARGALYHPFLAPDEEERVGQPSNGVMERDDDELFPHPPGQGVCADLHWRDQETGAWMAVDLEREERVLRAGEGQAIGYMGCELHPYVGYTEGEEPADDALSVLAFA